MEVTEIIQRGYVLYFCLSIIFFKSKNKRTNKPNPPPNQTPKHPFKIYGPVLP